MSFGHSDFLLALLAKSISHLLLQYRFALLSIRPC